jgi:hypothetical protein
MQVPRPAAGASVPTTHTVHWTVMLLRVVLVEHKQLGCSALDCVLLQM